MSQRGDGGGGVSEGGLRGAQENQVRHGQVGVSASKLKGV